MSTRDVEKESTNNPLNDGEEIEYPKWRRLTLIMIAVYFSMLIVALDRTIVGTAIPKITDDFHSITDVGWYGSAYLITLCSFQLFYARIYTFYSTKWVLMIAIVIFEIGSAVCGAAPNSTVFILGRAIAGVGSAGIFSGGIAILIISVPLHKRPVFQGLFGAVFGVASVMGPLVGGAFTTHVSWRWCFYINLPIGAVVIAIILLILKRVPSKNTDSLKVQTLKLDPYGSAVFLPAIICFLLALQWGGATYAWSNVRIIVLFILAGLLLIVFGVIQVKSGDRATIPIRIINQRSILSGLYFSLVSPGAMMVIVFYLPIWFQAVKGVSAVASGIDTIPLVLSLVVASIFSGGITGKTGYYVPQMIASSIISAIGAGMLTTLKVNTSSSSWIGYQVIFGFGLGLGMQQPGMAAQTCLSNKDTTTGVSLMFFMNGLGGAVWTAVGQTVFQASLISKIGGLANLNPALIINTGATEIRALVPPERLLAVLTAYNDALMDVMKVAVGLSTAGILGGLTMEWRSVKNKKQGGAAGEAEAKKGKKEATVGEQEVNTDSEAASSRREVDAAAPPTSEKQ
ncbi:major facilitator superfamily domain-containing protein [Amylocarpus encephaloides]|uniref:Major facilitator superfamily domain-containing protein n=1 Tax=Amylocarpus encephaloides TaxID=45428 RepID=A0A9P8C7M2_9HELO|nr:major facilitator superfamily domain-containing protein [Amylocarpus encephaloides]